MMKCLKYAFIILLSVGAFSCDDEPVLRDGGDDDDEPINIPPPPPPPQPIVGGSGGHGGGRSAYSIDSLFVKSR